MLHPLFYHSEKHFLFLCSLYNSSSIYYPNSVEMSVSDINHSVLIVVLVLFDTMAFKAKLNSLELYVKHFLKWVQTAANPTVRKSWREWNARCYGERLCLKTQFLRSNNLAHCEPGAKKIRQIRRASLAVYTYVTNDAQIREIISTSFAMETFQ